jgi:hypothetical protein
MSFLGLLKFWREGAFIVACLFCMALMLNIKNKNLKISEQQITIAEKQTKIDQDSVKFKMLKDDSERLIKQRGDAEKAANEWHSQYMMLNNDILNTDAGKTCEEIRDYIVESGRKLKTR